jgi:hypothetical protein
MLSVDDTVAPSDRDDSRCAVHCCHCLPITLGDEDYALTMACDIVEGSLQVQQCEVPYAEKPTSHSGDILWFQTEHLSDRFHGWSIAPLTGN